MKEEAAVFPLADASPVGRYVEAFRRECTTPMERSLLSLVLAEKPTQSDLDACLRVCDIEVLGAHKALMFSYLLHEHPDLDASGYAGPRIRGLNSFFRFANVKILAHFSRIGKALNAADIPFAVFKGAAMKVLRPALARPMGDVDILLPSERMAEAVRLGEGLGYRDGQTGATHAVDLLTEDGAYAVDIHRDVFGYGHESPAFVSGLLARAVPREAFGVRLLLPAHEDLLFITLVNMVKNLRLKTSLRGLLYALFDCRFLLADKPDFDWNLVRANAELTGQIVPFTLAVAFIHTLAPGLLAGAAEHFPLTENIQEFCSLALSDAAYYQKRYEGVQAELAEELRRSTARATPFHTLHERAAAFSDSIRRHVCERAFEVHHAD